MWHHAEAAEGLGAQEDSLITWSGDAGAATLRWPLATRLSTNVKKNHKKSLVFSLKS